MQKIYYMINNPAADCSMSLKFGTESHRVTPDLQQTFKLKGSKVKVTASDGQKLVNYQKLSGGLFDFAQI